MCDTFVVTPEKTIDGTMLLGKSADDQINEAHAVLHLPHKHYHPGQMVRTSNLLIPQVEETHEILLHRAFWSWGGEEGVNEHGLSIGAEAAVSSLGGKEPLAGLIGLDLLRLTLERAKTCQEAIEVMTGLLKTYGQGGNIEVSGNSQFDLTFLIADRNEAWILETAGREYAARPAHGIEAIGNYYCIGNDWQISSLPDEGVKEDWGEKLNVEDMVNVLGSRERRQASLRSLNSVGGLVSLANAFSALREHGPNITDEGVPKANWVCMHAASGEYRKWQAVNAIVSQVDQENVLVWSTGTAANCLSVFKPVFLGCGTKLPQTGGYPGECFDDDNHWWRHERLHRRAMLDAARWVPPIREEIEMLEASFITDVESVKTSNSSQLRQEYMQHCFDEAELLEARWIAKLEADPGMHEYPDNEFGRMWHEYNRYAGFIL